MPQRNRQYLKQEFQDGERPTGTDFGDVFDSFFHRVEDGLTLDQDGNLTLAQGLVLGTSNLDVQGALRLDNGQVEYHDGSDWVPITSGGGAFQQIGNAGEVVYQGGNVGIGSSFTTASPPTYRLEVPLGNNTGVDQRVRFGNGVCSNGQNAFQGYAYFSHQNHATNTNYGFRQGPNGNVNINAPNGQPVSIRHNGTSVRLGIATNGNVVVGSETNLTTGSQFAFQVNGSAFKNDGEDMWNRTSDIRVKENIRDLEVGLEELIQVRPVRFCYNGKAGTPPGKEGIGIIGQEIETILPETIQQIPSVNELGSDDPLRIYNGSALTYVLVNAVKELAARVQQLETALADARQETANS